MEALVRPNGKIPRHRAWTVATASAIFAIGALGCWVSFTPHYSVVTLRPLPGGKRAIRVSIPAGWEISDSNPFTTFGGSLALQRRQSTGLQAWIETYLLRHTSGDWKDATITFEYFPASSAYDPSPHESGTSTSGSLLVRRSSAAIGQWTRIDRSFGRAGATKGTGEAYIYAPHCEIAMHFSAPMASKLALFETVDDLVSHLELVQVTDSERKLHDR